MQKDTFNQDITKVLAEVASAVVGHFEMKPLLDQIVQKTMEILGAEVCSIFFDEEKNSGEIKCMAGSGFADKILGRTYKIGEGFTGNVAKYGIEFNIKDRNHLESVRFPGGEKWEGKYDYFQWPDGRDQFRNLLAVPLKIKDEILGVIKAENKVGSDCFTDEELIIFRTIANVIALTIENARLHKKFEEQSKNLSAALTKVTSAVVGRFNMEEIVAQVIKIAMNTLDAEVCSIFLKKEDEPNVIECVEGSGFASNILGKTYEIGEGVTGTVVQLGKEYNVKNRHQLENIKENGRIIWKGKFDKEQWEDAKTEFRNLLALPLKIKGDILGVIKVENKKIDCGHHFSDEDLIILRTIANVIALTIENAKLHKKNEEQLKAKEERDAWKEVAFRAGHKMGNAIFGLRGDIDWLKVVSEKPVDENKLISAIEEAQESLNGANKIIKEFKEYALPNELNLEMANINNVLERAISDIEKAVEVKASFKRNYAENLPDIEMDVMKFKQCIKEMIENACHFINQNGQIAVCSRISSNEDKELAGIPKNKKFISVIIKDNGDGVEYKNKTRIFLPFFSTTTKGSGIGLSIVQQYIEKHDGKIIEMGKYGQGAEFLILLPFER